MKAGVEGAPVSCEGAKPRPGALAQRGPAQRVAIVLTQLGYGGAERQSFELLARLAGTPRAPALVVCLSEDLEPYGPRLEALGYRLVALPRGRSFDLLRLWKLRRLLVRERIELVFAVNLLASGYAHLATLGLSHVTLVPSTRRTVVPLDALRSRVYRSMLRRAPLVLANSEAGARFLAERFGAPEERLRVVPNGLDFEQLRAAAASPDSAAHDDPLAAAEGRRVVGYVGKTSRVKRVDRFLEIVAPLLEEDPGLSAALFGSGLDESARATLAPGSDPARLLFCGPRADLPRHLARLDALVLCSESEGCPNALIEALALGTPVVGADVGDVAAMLRGCAAAHVVPQGELEAYRAALRALFADPSRAREAVRAHGPALEARYATKSMVEATLGVWDEALSASGPSRPRS